jgi:hypothetical protein
MPLITPDHPDWRCKNCVFSKVVKRYPDDTVALAECHCNPPPFKHIDLDFDWCGQFKSELEIKVGK